MNFFVFLGVAVLLPLSAQALKCHQCLAEEHLGTYKTCRWIGFNASKDAHQEVREDICNADEKVCFSAYEAFNQPYLTTQNVWADHEKRNTYRACSNQHIVDFVARTMTMTHTNNITNQKYNVTVMLNDNNCTLAPPTEPDETGSSSQGTKTSLAWIRCFCKEDFCNGVGYMDEAEKIRTNRTDPTIALNDNAQPATSRPASPGSPSSSTTRAADGSTGVTKTAENGWHFDVDGTLIKDSTPSGSCSISSFSFALVSVAFLILAAI